MPPPTPNSEEPLNAPFGARCFLTARRVAPPVARENVVPDRQWPKSTPPTSKHEARLPDFSLRLLVSPRNACGADAVPEIAAIVGVLLLHNALRLESNRKVVEWKDRQ